MAKAGRRQPGATSWLMLEGPVRVGGAARILGGSQIHRASLPGSFSFPGPAKNHELATRGCRAWEVTVNGVCGSGFEDQWGGGGREWEWGGGGLELAVPGPGARGRGDVGAPAALEVSETGSPPGAEAAA